MEKTTRFAGQERPLQGGGISANAWKGKGVKYVVIIIWGEVSVKVLRQLGAHLACKEWKGQQLGHSDKEACSVVKGGSDLGALGELW